MKKRWFAGLLTLSAITLVGCSSGDKAESDKAVATTSEGNITESQLYDQMKETAGTTALQQLILTTVLEGQVKDKDNLKEKAKADVAGQIEQYGGEDSFNSLLAQSGYANKDAYEKSVYLNNLVSEVVESKVDLSDKAVEAYYKDWQPDITVDHILVDDEDTAKDIIKQLDDGADFAELASKYSTDTATKDNGGEIGPFGKGEMDAGFEEAAYGLEKVGDITPEPVQSSYGYHVIKLVDKPEKGALDDVRDELEKDMKNEKLNDTAFVQDTIAQLVKDSDVKIKDSDLESVLDNFKTSEEQQEDSDTNSGDATTDDANTNSDDSDSDKNTDSDSNSDSDTNSDENSDK